MNLPGVIMLGAATPRSQAYTQRMQRAGIRIDATLVFEKPGQSMPGQGASPVSATQPCCAGVLLPDLGIPLLESAQAISRQITRVHAASVNDPLICAKLRELSPRLVIYSGFGGQIVSSELLGLGAPFLHMHSGWLPDYRGSTTTYYSLLRERRCGVSAILLNAGIDLGQIVARKWFPAPPPGIDLDYSFDSAIRADLLVDALARWAEEGGFSRSCAQAGPEGETYYVIHPVLKHLAIMGLSSKAGQ